MSKNEFACDCNIIHEELVADTLGKIQDDDAINKVAEFFKILGDTTRVKILFALDQNELCVCDIANVLNMTKSSISHQLGTLRRSGIVKCKKVRKRSILYARRQSRKRCVWSCYGTYSAQKIDVFYKIFKEVFYDI